MSKRKDCAMESWTFSARIEYNPGVDRPGVIRVISDITRLVPIYKIGLLKTYFREHTEVTIKLDIKVCREWFSGLRDRRGD